MSINGSGLEERARALEAVGDDTMNFLKDNGHSDEYAVLVSMFELEEEEGLASIIMNVPDEHRATLIVRLLNTLRHNEPEVYREVIRRLLSESLSEFAEMMDDD